VWSGIRCGVVWRLIVTLKAKKVDNDGDNGGNNYLVSPNTETRVTSKL
jgi:hypothetical protein